MFHGKIWRARLCSGPARGWLRRRAGVLPGLLVCLLTLLARRVPAAVPTLMDAAAFRSLAPDQRADTPVKVRGTITYRDQVWNFFVLQDETGGVPVLALGLNPPLAIGNRVEVEGIAMEAFGLTSLAASSMRLIEKGALPEALPTTIAELIAGRHDAMRVEVAGVIGATDIVQGHSLLHVHSGTNHLDAIVRDLSPADPLLPRLVGAGVRLRGTSCRALLPRSRSIRPYLLVSGMSEIEVTEPASSRPFEGPISSIRDVSATNTAQRVKIFANVRTDLTNWTCTVADDTGSLVVRANRGTRIRRGDVAEVTGFPSRLNGATILDHAMFQLVARSEPKSAQTNVVTAASNQFLPVLETVTAVRWLTPEEADCGYPVRLRGVVTFYEPHSKSLFLHAQTNGIFVWPSDTNLPVRVGDFIELSGFSSAGLYAPIVVGGRVSVLAPGELPPALEMPFQQLLSGQYDCERVAVDGIVRSVSSWANMVSLQVAAHGRSFTVLLASTNVADAAKLVDAEVLCHGVCGTDANDRRQIIGLKLFVPLLSDILVKEPGPNDPFALPIRTVMSLLSYQPREKPGHRVHLRGVVTMQRRSETFFIRDHTGALFVQLLGTHQVEPGDIVELAGFPNVTGTSAVLQDALVRTVGRTNPPAAVPIVAGQALQGFHEGEWVSLEGRLMDINLRGEQPVLTIESGPVVFEAIYVRTNVAASFKHLRQGESLRIPGICSLRPDEGGVPRSFRLQCGSPEGLVILQRKPWWTLRHALVLAGGLTSLVLAALTWAWMLRRQVGKQTGVIRQLNSDLERRVAERTAELEAANRELESFSYSVSHDLRAPLRSVNGFAEILLTSHASNLDEKSSRYLRNVADSGRRMGRLVDDLLTFSRLGRQPLSKSPLDLNALVASILDDLRAQDPQRRVTAHLQSLPPAQGDHSLIRQVLFNLLSNAWKFTANRPEATIDVGFLTHGHGPAYFVKDNGAGFDMNYAGKLFGVFQRLHRDDEFPGTGVGLAIVQRIIHRHGGRVWAESQPGAGATFYFTLPAGSLKNEPCIAFGK